MICKQIKNKSFGKKRSFALKKSFAKKQKLKKFTCLNKTLFTALDIALFNVILLENIVLDFTFLVKCSLGVMSVPFTHTY